MKWNWETGASQSSAADFKTAKNRNTDLEKKQLYRFDLRFKNFTWRR